MTHNQRFIRVLPSGGKTYVTRVSEGSIRYEDSDAILEKIGLTASKEGFEEMRDNPSHRKKFVDAMNPNKIMLTNFDPQVLRNELDSISEEMFAYHPDEYVDHIKFAGRDDLLKNFPETELREWAQSAIDLAEERDITITMMQPDQFVGDFLLSN